MISRPSHSGRQNSHIRGDSGGSDFRRGGDLAHNKTHGFCRPRALTRRLLRVFTVSSIFGALCFAAGVARAETLAGSAPTSVVARAEAIFGCVEQKFEAARALQYTVERTTQSARQTVRERWLFRFRQPGDIRIDYQVPDERLILVSSAAMIEYLPAVRKAMRTRLAKLNALERQKVLAAVLGRVSVEGLRLGDYHAMAGRAIRITPDAISSNVVEVEGAGPRFKVQIDLGRKVLLGSEVWNAQDEIVLRTAASDWVEGIPGFWLPRQLVVDYGTKEGVVRSRITLSDVLVNQALPAELFEFVPGNDVTMLER